MTLFAIGFVFIMIFTVLVGIGAVIFISFDASPSERPSKVSQDDLYNIVRQVNTNTIETVDMAGSIQTWVRMSE
ncbi:MAG: hypothetical protein Phog2KO_13380 [Phototrophicaceae bacterium]